MVVILLEYWYANSFLTAHMTWPTQGSTNLSRAAGRQASRAAGQRPAVNLTIVQVGKAVDPCASSRAILRLFSQSGPTPAVPSRRPWRCYHCSRQGSSDDADVVPHSKRFFVELAKPFDPTKPSGGSTNSTPQRQCALAASPSASLRLQGAARRLHGAPCRSQWTPRYGCASLRGAVLCPPAPPGLPLRRTAPGTAPRRRALPASASQPRRPALSLR